MFFCVLTIAITYFSVSRTFRKQFEKRLTLVINNVERQIDVNDLEANIKNNSERIAAGDEHIKNACKLICDVFKNSPVFRVGGDEFVVIARGADYEQIDDLVIGIDAANFANAGYGKVTVACGMAKYEIGDKNVAAVFTKSDKKMYVYKRDMKKLG